MAGEARFEAVHEADGGARCGHQLSAMRSLVALEIVASWFQLVIGGMCRLLRVRAIGLVLNPTAAPNDNQAKRENAYCERGRHSVIIA